MSKKVKLTATDLGTDVGLIDIYHTSTVPANLLTSSISASVLTTTGIEFIVDDSVTFFIAKAIDGECLNSTGSISVTGESITTRYFDVFSDGNGTVEETAPFVVSPTTSSFAQTVDYTVYSTFTIEATETYPFTFDGWYDAETAGSLITTTNPLSITLTDFPSNNNFYARFS